jgi:hypothetical protein
MIKKINIDPRENIWGHHIAHGSGEIPNIQLKNFDKSEIQRDLTKKYNKLEPLSCSVTFKGSNLLCSEKVVKSIAKEFAPIEKKNAKEAYGAIKNYLEEPLKLAFENMLDKYGDKAPNIIVSEPIYYRFQKAIESPFNWLSQKMKFTLANPQVKKSMMEQDKSNHVLAGLEGAYRKVAELDDKSIEKGKKAISEYLTKDLNKIKSNYSTSTSSAMIRLIAGVLSGIFVANDFSNLKRVAHDDPNAAKEEWKSKFKQVMTCVGMSTYLGYITTTTFKKAVNASIKFAVGLTIINTIATEIISRKLTGRPIFIQRNADKSKENNIDNPVMNKLNSEKNPFSAFINNTKPVKKGGVSYEKK